jgi:outer membrane protein OmpA-like peptidoglycan-associated protein
MAANDTIAFKAAASRSLGIGGSDPELVTAAASLHESVGYHCAEEEVAKLEVQTAWAAHEAHGPGACFAQPHLEEARRLASDAKAKADDCIKAAAPPPPPPPPPAPPVAPNQEIAEALSGIPSGIHFALNKSDLSPTSRNVVKRIAAVLVKYPNVRVELEGHTDSRGSAEYNLALSKRRAEAVQAGLVAEGVAQERITTTFAGKANLLNAEKDVTDLALNRRVDFKYYDENGASIKAEKQTGDIQVEKPKPPARKAPTKKKTTQ